MAEDSGRFPGDEVYLGFGSLVSPEMAYRLKSHYMPLGKIGGKPSWLSPVNLPSSEELLCKVCSKPLVFLLQVYATNPNDNEYSFHRSLFFFICRNSDCSQPNDASNIRAFRCQLPRKNEYYSDIGPLDPDIDGNVPDPMLQPFYPHLCDLCGCMATKKCGRCERTWYCCRDHQAFDWVNGHKNVCGISTSEEGVGLKFKKPTNTIGEESEVRRDEGASDIDDNMKQNSSVDNLKTRGTGVFSSGNCERNQVKLKSNHLSDAEEGCERKNAAGKRSANDVDSITYEVNKCRLNGFVFPEYAIEMDMEWLPYKIEDDDSDDEDNDSEEGEGETLEQRMNEYRDYMKKHKAVIGLADAGAEEYESNVKKDKAFERFSKVIEADPKQILRYSRGGRVLLATDFAPAPSLIPSCSLCGSSRQYEMQLMPHLVALIGVDTIGKSIDWATVILYTCSNNCQIKNNGYAEEYVFKQDFR